MSLCVPMGTTLKICCGLYDHYGIANGKGGVIHNSKRRGKVVEETIEEFSDGHVVKISDIKGSCLIETFERAKRYIGLKYELFVENCEHFVRMANGLIKESKQIQKYLLMTAGAGVALVSKNPVLKMAGAGALIGSLATSEEDSPGGGAALGTLVGLGLGALFMALTS